MHRPHHISDRNILSIPDNIANHQKENKAACWYSESNMVTAPWGWRAVTTVLKQGSKSNAVKTSCFRHFSLGMYWLKRLKVMEGLPRKLISGNPRSTLWLFFWSRLHVGHVSTLEVGTKCPQAFPQESFGGPSSPKPGIFLYVYIYIYVCHHAFGIFIFKWRAVLECFGNISLHVVPHAITLLCAGFPHLMFFLILLVN